MKAGGQAGYTSTFAAPHVSITRRNFLTEAGLALAATTGKAAEPSPLLSTNSLQKFVDRLPTLEVVKPAGRRPSPDHLASQISYYSIAMRQFQAKVHRDVPPTTFWGYGGTSPGPTLVVRSGEGFLVNWINELPNRHLLPLDHTLHGAETDKPDVRTVVHVHGARVPPESDGYPEHWHVPGQSALHYYPNNQEAATLFYHDHTMGITRLNTVAGLFGFCLVRDSFEDSLRLPVGEFEIPLLIYDRTFRQNGELAYLTSGNPDSPWIPEYFGNAILVNGKIYPYLEVEPRKYRLRILNGSNGGFYNLCFTHGQTFFADHKPFVQIGSDQGFLAAPARLEKLFLSPGERADLIVDFSSNAGEQIHLQHQNGVIMQFRVSARKVRDSFTVPDALRPISRIAESSAVKTRNMSLADYQDRLGMSKIMLLNNTHWSMPVTEKPVLNTVEVWNLINLTDDSHPIHLHLVRFQILDRRHFDISTYQLTDRLVFTGDVLPPAANESGWKDTVRADSLMVTRIIVRFEGYLGRYVWHCHILEHEDNEMMRPYEIVSDI